MATLFRSSKRLIVLILLSLTALAIIHQLSYASDLVFPNHLSELMEVIKTCNLQDPRPDSPPRSDTNPEIPNIIHQIWKTSNVSTYSIEASHESWKAMFESKNYTVKLWAEKDIVELIHTKYDWLLETYQGYSRNILRADVARLVVLHAEGGIYADLDVYPKSVEAISCLQRLGFQGIFAPTSNTAGLSNHFIMARQGSEFLERTLHEAKERWEVASGRILLPYLQVFWSTGPIMVTASFQKYALHAAKNHQVAVAEEGYVRTIVSHAAGRSWHSLDGQLLNYIGDHVTERTVWMGALLLGVILGLAYIIVYYRKRSVFRSLLR